MSQVHYCLSPLEFETLQHPTVAYVIRIKNTLRFFRDFGKGKRLKTDWYLACARHFWTTTSPQFKNIIERLNLKGVDYEIIRFEIGA